MEDRAENYYQMEPDVGTQQEQIMGVLGQRGMLF